MIRHLRLGLIPFQIFNSKIKQHPYIRDNEECKPIIGETLRLLYKLDHDGSMVNTKNLSSKSSILIHQDTDVDCPLIRPRYSHEMIVAFGGWSGGSATSMLEAYDVRADKWTVISTDRGRYPLFHTFY